MNMYMYELSYGKTDTVLVDMLIVYSTVACRLRLADSLVCLFLWWDVLSTSP